MSAAENERKRRERQRKEMHKARKSAIAKNNASRDVKRIARRAANDAAAE